MCSQSKKKNRKNILQIASGLSLAPTKITDATRHEAKAETHSLQGEAEDWKIGLKAKAGLETSNIGVWPFVCLYECDMFVLPALYSWNL